MKPDTAFATFQTTVNADAAQVKEAILRRNAFLGALTSPAEVVRAQCIGSFARRTQLAPLNDVDILLIFDSESHPGWGSAQIDRSPFEALTHTASLVKALLGPSGSDLARLNPDGGTDLNVRLAHRKRHSVKCFLDRAGAEDAFTVDVVPAVEHPLGGVWIPERNLEDDDGGTWVRSNPQVLIDVARSNQDAWGDWIRVVRLLKYWNRIAGAGMTSLYVEVLAHSCLPSNETKARAIARFFQSAYIEVSAALEDPARLCGPIQPDLEVAIARDALDRAASLAWDAANAEADGRHDDAVCAWRALFGTAFPEPPCGCDGSQAKVSAITAASTVSFPSSQPSRGPRRVRDSPQG